MKRYPQRLCRTRVRAFLFALFLGWVLWGCAQPTGVIPGALRIGGSASARDLVEALVEAFRVEHPDTPVDLLPSTHSGAALVALRSGELDVACLTREPEPAERRGLLVYPFALDPLVFAAHRSAGVDSITTQQVRWIYSGRVRNWKQVGGNDLPVFLLDRPEYTSPKRLLRRTIFSELQIAPSALVLESPDLMDEALTVYAGAIGYTSLRAALALGDRVVVLRLDGTVPGPETVRSGRYRLARAVSFAVRRVPHPSVRRFVEFLQGARAREVAEDRAMVPVRREIRVGVPPVRNVVAIEAKYGPLIRYLADRLGRPVELVHEPTYPDLTEAFRTNLLDAAFAGSFAYVVAHVEAGVEALARPDYGGVSHYRGVIYVRADSPYRAIEDLKGARVAHAGHATTAGQVFPLYLLKTNGLPAPERFFGAFVDAGSHEAAIRAVLEGRAEAAAAKDLVFEEMARETPEIRRKLRALAVSPPVPSNAFVAGPLLPPALREHIRTILLEAHRSPQGRKALSALGATRFIRTTDEDYRNLREMISVVSDKLIDHFHYR